MLSWKQCPAARQVQEESERDPYLEALVLQLTALREARARPGLCSSVQPLSH